MDDVCTGCHIILPPQFVNDVRTSDSIMFCPDCSRILYYRDQDEMTFDMDFLDNTEEEAPKAEEEEEDSSKKSKRAVKAK